MLSLLHLHPISLLYPQQKDRGGTNSLGYCFDMACE